MTEVKKESENRKKRSAEIRKLADLFQATPGGVVTDYRGLNVEQITELRRKFRQQGVNYKVVKNTLTRLAVAETGYRELEKLLSGPTGIAFAQEDLLAPARVAMAFSRSNESLKIKGGFMEGQVLTDSQVAEVSSLSGVKELKAQLLAALNGPAQRLLGALVGAPQKLLGVLQAQADKMQAGS